MKKAIEIDHFRKSFGNNLVIKDLSFDVYSGEIFSFIGANGSGKTTTIRSLLNIIQADAGTLKVYGQTYTPDMSSVLGYLPEERGLYINSKVLETMIYLGQLKGMTYNDARLNAVKYLERIELSDKADHKIKQLSSGQQQKIQLGITVINQPKLLILDEPTKGLDPVNRSLMLEILMELNKNNNTTILFSTHQLEEAEKIANRLIMIKHGDKVLYGNVDEVKRSFGTNVIHITYKGKFPINKKLYEAIVDTNVAELTPQKGATTDMILRYLVDSSIEIIEFRIGTPSLNEIFIKVSSDVE